MHSVLSFPASGLTQAYDPAEDMHWATRVNAEGRIDVDVDLASVPTVPPSEYGGELDLDTLRADECPPLNIVIFIVGSRGDVQPYLALALELIRTRGHRVRLATHAIFADLVQQATVRLAGHTDASGSPLTSKLEHFNIGGSPEELMSYMVRNPGLVPGISAIANGDIRRKRRMVKQMLVGCYLSCFSPSDRGEEFAADAIISNPPAFAHIHVAEALGIPLLMSFSASPAVPANPSHAVDTHHGVPAPARGRQELVPRPQAQQLRVLPPRRRAHVAGPRRPHQPLPLLDPRAAPALPHQRPARPPTPPDPLHVRVERAPPPQARRLEGQHGWVQPRHT
jgi:hypothetical protein